MKKVASLIAGLSLLVASAIAQPKSEAKVQGVKSKTERKKNELKKDMTADKHYTGIKNQEHPVLFKKSPDGG